MKKMHPYFSIVLCTYNGANKIENSLNSLFSQDFPKEKFEVIVVNDGSIDETEKVVSKFPIILVKHIENKGLAAARNSGLRKSNGEIIICFDDDCIADKNWLKNLSRAYEDDNVMGAGGMINLSKTSSMTDEYCFYSGYGNPVPMILGRSRSAQGRLWNYLIANFSNPQSKFKDFSFVFELPGILSSFRKRYLIEVDGWNENLVNVGEDTEICRKLKIKYPNLNFVVVPSARVVHEQKLSFINFLNKEYKRGEGRSKYYALKKEKLPFFPAPFVFIFILFITLVLTFIFKTFLPILFIIVLPYLLYPWWIFRSIKERKIKMLVFPYMQLMHEGVTLLGML